MGELIATTQATVDGVVDPVGEWVQPDSDHGELDDVKRFDSGVVILTYLPSS